MPNKIDISQTDAQLSASITTWSGSNLIGPVQSVPIYNATGTASVAQAPSDEYYLVRRNGTIQWAPIVAGGAGIMFGISSITEQSLPLPLVTFYEFEEISPFNLGIGTKNLEYKAVVKKDYFGIPSQRSIENEEIESITIVRKDYFGIPLERSIDNEEVESITIVRKDYFGIPSQRSIENEEIDSTPVITTANNITNNESGSFV